MIVHALLYIVVTSVALAASALAIVASGYLFALGVQLAGGWA